MADVVLLDGLILVSEVWGSCHDWLLKDPNMTLGPCHLALSFLPVSELGNGANNVNFLICRSLIFY